MLLVKNPPRNNFNANPPHSLFNSFRNLPKVFRPANLNCNKNVNQKKAHLTLPSLPLPRHKMQDDKFASKDENINPFMDIRSKRKISPRTRRKQTPLVMKMPNLIPSGAAYLHQNERKRARTVNPLTHANKVQIMGATSRTAFARKKMNIDSNPPSLMNPNIVVAQASKPKQASFRLPQFAKVEAPTFSKSIPTLKVSAPKTMSVVEDLTFFLDRKEPRQLKPDEICPNAPDSDDECERDYDLVDATLAHDFGGQDEIIVGHNPLRKKCRYLGVSWNTQHVKWIAQVGYRGKRHYVGQFLDCRRAAMAIDAFCIDLGIAPRNRSRLACRGKKKSLNPNWQTRGERTFKSRNYYE